MSRRSRSRPPAMVKSVVKPSRGRNPASTRWLQRQFNDPYVLEAKRRRYRSRAAFKLIELDDKFGLLRPDQRVIDLGAAPGGWTQVIVERTVSVPSSSQRQGQGSPQDGGLRIVAIDRLAIEPLEGVMSIAGDLRDRDMLPHIKAILGAKADLVLSDMAPDVIGHPSTDHLRILALAELAYHFAQDRLASGGNFVVKIFQGGSLAPFLRALREDFSSVRSFKPAASRKISRETYIVARGFHPP